MQEPSPKNYIILEDEEGTFTAYINYGTFKSKEEAEKSLEIIMDMMGYKLEPQVTIH